MKVVITAITERGENSTEKEVSKTFEEALRIAGLVSGKIIYGRGFHDGTEIILEK
jgi:hypothetical protein